MSQRTRRAGRCCLSVFLFLCLLPGPGGLALAETALTLISDVPTLPDGSTVPGLPRHFRSTAFPLGPRDSISPDSQDMADLRLSGSAQFTAAQFAALCRHLPAPLLVLDLRQESHGFLDGLAVSWFADKDWANRGLRFAEVRDDEERRLAGLLAMPKIPVAMSFAKNPDGSIEHPEYRSFAPRDVCTEAELVLRHGAGYLRLACPDHLPPPDEEVDRFLEVWQRLDPAVWLHMHCHAGDGRTTTFMAMVDMLRHAGHTAFENIVARQQRIGGIDLALRPPDEPGWKRDAWLARAAFLQRFYRYAKEGHAGSGLRWSEWNRRPD